MLTPPIELELVLKHLWFKPVTLATVAVKPGVVSS